MPIESMLSVLIGHVGRLGYVQSGVECVPGLSNICLSFLLLQFSYYSFWCWEKVINKSWAELEGKTKPQCFACSPTGSIHGFEFVVVLEGKDTYGVHWREVFAFICWRRNPEDRMCIQATACQCNWDAEHRLHLCLGCLGEYSQIAKVNFKPCSLHFALFIRAVKVKTNLRLKAGLPQSCSVFSYSSRLQVLWIWLHHCWKR